MILEFWYRVHGAQYDERCDVLVQGVAGSCFTAWFLDQPTDGDFGRICDHGNPAEFVGNGWDRHSDGVAGAFGISDLLLFDPGM